MTTHRGTARRGGLFLRKCPRAVLSGHMGPALQNIAYSHRADRGVCPYKAVQERGIGRGLSRQ